MKELPIFQAFNFTNKKHRIIFFMIDTYIDFKIIDLLSFCC